jgi:hypothetical protein
MIANLLLNRYIIGAAVITVLLFGGYKLLKSRWAWKDRAQTAEKVVGKTQEVQDEKQKIHKETHDLSDDSMAEYYRTGRVPGSR